MEVHVHANTLEDKKDIGSCWSLKKMKGNGRSQSLCLNLLARLRHVDTRIHVAVFSIAAEFMKLSIVL